MDNQTFKWTPELKIEFFDKCWNKAIFDKVDFNTAQLEFIKSNEVKTDKDYEIISLKCNDGAISTYGDKNQAVYQDRMRWIKAFIDAGTGWKIHSVKRLSDGIVFTVGDMIDQLIPQAIEYFALYKEGTISAGGKNWGGPLDRLKKAKQPLFKTEDGKDIYEGDVYWVRKNEFTNGSAFAENIALSKKVYDDIYLYFSTKEKAKEYVLMNKPCLSVNNVLEAHEKEHKKPRPAIWHFQWLTDAAKQKIESNGK